MSSSDPSVTAIIIKLICVAASIVIGAIMAVESQRNAVQRRALLLAAVREGSPRSLIKQLGAFLLNLIFLWMLQFAIVTLLAVMVGSELQMLFNSTPYMVVVSILGATLPVFAIAGKRILPHHLLKTP